MFQTTKLMLWVTLCLGLISVGQLHPASSAAADKPIPLHIAIQKGLVDVEVLGRGASTGDSVQVSVKRRGGVDVAVSVEPGTVIQPKAGPVQSMALAGVKYKQVEGGLQKADLIELNDDGKHTYILEGYCRDIEKPTPNTQDSFAVTGPDAENAKVLVHAKRLGATVKVTQSAIWIQRSKLSDEDLRRHFQVSVEELDAARQLLVAVERPDPARDVDVKVVLDHVRQLAARNPGSNIKRGDTVETLSDEAEFKSRRGDKTLGKLPKGQQLEVLGLVSDSVVVRAEVEGEEKQRGLVRAVGRETCEVRDSTDPERRAAGCRRRAGGSVRQGRGQRGGTTLRAGPGLLAAGTAVRFAVSGVTLSSMNTDQEINP